MSGMSLSLLPLWWLTVLPTIYAEEIRIGIAASLSGNLILPSSLLGALPALDRVNSDPSLLPEHSLTFTWADSRCDTPDAAPAGSALISDGADLVISTCSQVAALMGPWLGVNGVYHMSYAATDPTLSDQDLYPYYSRVCSTNLLFSKATAKLYQLLGLTHACLLFQLTSSYDMNWQSVSSATYTDLNISVFNLPYTELGQSQISTLRLSGYRAVSFLTYRCAQIRTFLAQARKVGLLSSLFVVAESVDTSCVEDSDDNSTADFDSFKGLFRVTVHFGANATSLAYLDSFKSSMSGYLNPAYGGNVSEAEVSLWKADMFSALVFDTIILYATALDKVIKAGGSIRDLALLQATVTETTISGLTGHLQLDEAGDRLSDVAIGYLDADEAGTSLIANEACQYRGVSETLDVLSSQDSWLFLTGSSTPPAGYVNVCDAGAYYDAALAHCVPCSPGSSAEGTGFQRTECDSCAPGKYQPESKQEVCLECPVGTFSASEGLTECSMAPVGTYTQSTGEVSPTSCPANMTTELSGSKSISECVCQTDYFLAGGGVCEACPHGSSTTGLGKVSVQSCLCSSGTYMPEDNSRCQNCLAGMECREGSSVAAIKAALSSSSSSSDSSSDSSTTTNEEGEGEVSSNNSSSSSSSADEYDESVPLLTMPGFYTTKSNPLVVYKCQPNVNSAPECPGGLPESCNSNRYGFVCAECPAGFFTETDGSCSECDGWSIVPAILMATLVPIFLSAWYHFSLRGDTAGQKGSTLLVSIVFTQGLTLLQQLGVLYQLTITWPEPFKGILGFVSTLTFAIEFLKLGCVAKTPPLAEYSTRTFLIFALLLVLLLNFLFHRAISRKSSEITALFSACGYLLMALYISIASATCIPFRCYSHPNGEMSVQDYPPVLCWTGEWDEHRGMILVGTFASLIPSSFLVGCVYAVVRFPAYMKKADTDYLHRFAFLFARVRVETYWYPIIFLVRNLFLALIPIVPDTMSQLLLMFSAYLICLVTATICHPWRNQKANFAEAFLNSGMLFIITLACPVLDWTEELSRRIGTACCVIFVSTISILGIVIVYAIVYENFFLERGRPFEFFICHHKAGAGSLARLLKMHLSEDPRVKKRVWIDSDDLVDITLLFGYIELYTDKVVAICSRDILQRPWCVGELTTARISKIPTTLIHLSDFTFPDEQFRQDYATMVPETTVLAPHGISAEMLSETLAWLETIRRFKLASRLSLHALDAICTFLITGSQKSNRDSRLSLSTNNSMVSGSNSLGGTPSFGVIALDSTASCLNHDHQHEVAILVNPNQIEAAATAFILQKLLIPILSDRAMMTARVIDSGVLPDKTKKVILICSNSCFICPMVISSLFRAWEMKLFILPIIAQEGFRMPSTAFWSELRTEVQQVMADHSPELLVEEYMHILQHVFQEIAVVVQPADYSSTHELLVLKADMIAKRLTMPKKAKSGPLAVPESNASERRGSTFMPFASLKRIMTASDFGSDEASVRSSMGSEAPGLFASTGSQGQPVVLPRNISTRSRADESVRAEDSTKTSPCNTEKLGNDVVEVGGSILQLDLDPPSDEEEEFN